MAENLQNRLNYIFKLPGLSYYQNSSLLNLWKYAVLFISIRATEPVWLKDNRKILAKQIVLITTKVKELPKFKTLNDHKQVSNTLYFTNINRVNMSMPRWQLFSSAENLFKFVAEQSDLV
jgi:hypothetical protein